MIRPSTPAEQTAKRLIASLKREQKFIRAQQEKTDAFRIDHAASDFDSELLEKYADDPSFMEWCPNRALNWLDSEYLYFHRRRLGHYERKLLEIVAAKIHHLTNAGEDGYFSKAENNIGWTEHITPMIMVWYPFTEKIVKCGLWCNAQNSRRCHKTEFCPYCLWIDVLKPLLEEFGADSGAFARAPCWWFITCGFTTKPNNAKSVSGDLGPDSFAPPTGRHEYDPYPLVLGQDACTGYEDGRLGGLISQEAVDDLYKRRLVDGYRHKIEGAYAIFPGKSNRVNLHGHTIANGRESDGQFLAKELYASMQAGLAKYRPEMHRDLYPDVKVERINSAI